MTKFSMKDLQQRVSSMKSGDNNRRNPHGGYRSHSQSYAGKRKRAPVVNTDITVVVAARVKTEADASQLIRELKEHCEAHPALSHTARPLTNSKGKFRNMVRIEFPSKEAPEGLAALISTFNGKNIGGSKITLKQKDAVELTEATDAEEKTTPDATDDTAKEPAAKKRKVEEPIKKYFLGNLPRGVAVEEAERLLRDAFGKKGLRFGSIKMLKNEFNMPNGCAVVMLCKAKQQPVAEKLIALEHIKVKGRPVRMEEKLSAADVQDPSSVRLIGDRDVVFAANLPLTIEKDQIKEAFGKWGEVVEVKMNETEDSSFNGTARVKYANTHSVARAVHHTGVLLVNRRPIRIDFDKRKGARSAQLDLTPAQLWSKTIMVTPMEASRRLLPAAVKKMFSTIGRVKFCRKAYPEDDPHESFPAGSVLLSFTLSACVGIAMQFAGKDVDSVPLSLGNPKKGEKEAEKEVEDEDDEEEKEENEDEGEEKEEKEDEEGEEEVIDKQPCGILVKVMEGTDESGGRRPDEVSFTFGGVRAWYVNCKRVFIFSF